MVSFQPTQDEIYTYDALFDYLKSRDRCGLVATFSNKIKDFYVIPLDSKSAVPDALLPDDDGVLPKSYVQFQITERINRVCQPNSFVHSAYAICVYLHVMAVSCKCINV